MNMLYLLLNQILQNINLPLLYGLNIIRAGYCLLAINDIQVNGLDTIIRVTNFSHGTFIFLFSIVWGRRQRCVRSRMQSSEAKDNCFLL